MSWFPVPSATAQAGTCLELLRAGTAIKPGSAHVYLFKRSIFPTEAFRWYVRWDFSDQARTACRDAASEGIVFKVIYGGLKIPVGVVPGQISNTTIYRDLTVFVPMTPVAGDDGVPFGFHASIETKPIDLFGGNIKPENIPETAGFGSLEMAVGLADSSRTVLADLGRSNKALIVQPEKEPGVKSHPVDPSPLMQAQYEEIARDVNSEGGTADTGTPGHQDKWQPNEIKIKTNSSATTYRVVYGQDARIRYSLDWQDPTADHPRDGDTFREPRRQYNATINGYYIGLDYTGRTYNNEEQGGRCQKFEGSGRCSGIVESGDNIKTLPFPANQPNGYKEQYIPWKGTTLEQDYQAALSSGAGASGGPVLTKGFDLFPVVALRDWNTKFDGTYADWTVSEEGKVTVQVQVFKSFDDILTACAANYKKEHPDDTSTEEQLKQKCESDPTENLWREEGQPQSANAGSTATGDPGGCAAANIGCWILDILARIIGFIISWINEVIYFIFYMLIVPAIETVLGIRTYTDTFASVIYPGWQLMRNLGNIFFILALLVTALATLFRVQGYQYKQILVDLVISAVLVNFSLVFAQGILAIAETAQNQFLPNNQIVVRSLGKQLMVAPIRYDVYYSGSGNDSAAGLSKLVRPFVFLILAIGSFLTFASIAVYLVIRMIMLWLLLMLSPVPYIARVLPATKSFEKQWWDYFLKYAFFIPVMALFLNLTAVIANQYPRIVESISGKQFALESSSRGLASLLIPTAGAASDNPNASAAIFGILSTVVLLGILLAGSKIAQTAGVLGASAIGDITKKGTMALPALAQFGAKAAGRWGKRRYDEKTTGLASGGKGSQLLFRALHPVTSFKALQKESERNQEITSGRLEAAAKKVARNTYGWRRRSENPMFLYDEHEGAKLYEEEEGEISENEQQVVAVANRLAREGLDGDVRATMKLKHLLKQMARKRNFNEAMGGDNGLAKNFLGYKIDYTQNGVRQFIMGLAHEKIIDHHFAEDFLKNLSKDGYETGDFNLAELTYSDPETGEAKLIETEMEIDEATGKMTGRAIAKGDKYYRLKKKEFIDTADAKARAEAPAGTSEEDIVKLAQSKVAAMEKAEAAKNKDYLNAMKAEESKLYMLVNMSKQKGGQQVEKFHDSLINNGVVDGKMRISDAGEQTFGKMDMGILYALARDGAAPKTKEKFMPFIDAAIKDQVKGRQAMRDEIKRLVENDAFRWGTKLSDTALQESINQMETMWMGAGVAIKTSSAGSAISASYFENANYKNSEDIYQAMVTKIRDVEGKGKITTP